MAPRKIRTTISKKEFSQWLTPSKALEVLSRRWSYDVAMSTVIRYLMHGELRARAAKVIVARQGDEQTFYRSPIPRQEWDYGKPNASSDFWEAGSFDWSDGSGYHQREFSAFDV